MKIGSISALKPLIPETRSSPSSLNPSAARWKGKQRQLTRFSFPSRVLCSFEPLDARNNGTLAGKSSRLLIDCGPEQECVLGGIVALGKFDALHIGHRQLAIQAAKSGPPFLLSFVGIAQVLGWEYRAPIVAQCDRKRVLSSWAPYCGNVVPVEYQVDFASVRYLSPRQFVERLSMELRVTGVVAGENYRFGYRACGDASDLVKLCGEYGLESYIVRPVMDDHLVCQNGTSTTTKTKEKVSSTSVRHALARGDMGYVQHLLGRKHRLVLSLDQDYVVSDSMLSVPKSCILNQPPKEGAYECCSLLVDDKFVTSCKVILDSNNIHVDINNKVGQSTMASMAHRFVGIEFG